MAIWVIGDTHLSMTADKPMDIFGSDWENHQERLRQHWESMVSAEDCVIIAGDISWALTLAEAKADLAFLDALPGARKILLRGNHDYWWSTRSKVERFLEEERLLSLRLFQNEAILLDEASSPILLVGSRGWKLPSDEEFTAGDLKILHRERERLLLSLREAKRLREDSSIPFIGVMHFPPLNREGAPSVFTELLESYAVESCYYGHVHGSAGRQSFRGMRSGVAYKNVACDQLGCKPWLIRR